MIVDNNFNKFNINKISRTGSPNASTSGTVYLGSGNKVNQNIASIEPHYLWGNLFNGTQDIDGDIEFKGNINFIGDDDGHHGNITAISAVLKNLTVTGTAYFAELVIDKIKSAGGAVILSPADGFEIIKITTVTNGVKLYFLAENEDKKIDNIWAVDDQLIIKDFNNATVGTTQGVTNRYFWGVVTGIDSQPEEITIEDNQTVKAHYVIVSDSDYDGILPNDDYIGAACVQLGNRSDSTRDGAIYLCAYDSPSNPLDSGLTAPFIAIYDGIGSDSSNYWNLSNHRLSWFAMNGNQVSGTLMVYDGNNNNFNSVKISPDSIGISADYDVLDGPKTVIGIDGLYSGAPRYAPPVTPGGFPVENTHWRHIFNGTDNIELQYDNYSIMLAPNGILRSRRVKTINGLTTNVSYIAPSDTGYGYEDISSCTNVTKITPSSSVNNFNLDGNDGFVIVYNNNPQITVNLNLPDVSLSTGCKLTIKGWHTVTVSGQIVQGSHSSAQQSLTIDNDLISFYCDGSYWYADNGV